MFSVDVIGLLKNINEATVSMQLPGLENVLLAKKDSLSLSLSLSLFPLKQDTA